MVKVTCPERLTKTGPKAPDGQREAYRDVVPFAKVLVEEFPDRVIWGTDWPHPNLKRSHARRWAACGFHSSHRSHDGATAKSYCRTIQCVCTGRRSTREAACHVNDSHILIVTKAGLHAYN